MMHAGAVLPVELLGDVALGADPHQPLHAPVHGQSTGEVEGEHRQHERHDLEDHRLGRVGVCRRVAGLDLTVLDHLDDQDQNQQHQVGRKRHEALGPGLGRRLRQVEREHPVEERHRVLSAQGLIERRGRVDVLGVEGLVGEHPGRQGRRVVGYLLGDVTDTGGGPTQTVRQTTDQVVHHDEHGRLGQHGEAATDRADVVFLIEHHQLGVEALPVALVLGLNLFEFGLESLHLQHRFGALHRERRDDEHHEHGEQHDRHPKRGDHAVDGGHDGAEELEQRGEGTKQVRHLVSRRFVSGG